MAGQNSADSQLPNGLLPDEESQMLLPEKRQHALKQLMMARDKPVSFALRTLEKYNGSCEDDSPVYGYVISFQANEFIHIKDKYDELWWIGRLVKTGCDVGFIPSPRKLETIRLEKLVAHSKSSKRTLVHPKTPDEILAAELSATNGSKFFVAPHLFVKKMFGKKDDFRSPYEVVPLMRPIVLVGPSLKGYAVSDLMQKSVLDFLEKRFKGRIIMTKVSADFSQCKRGRNISAKLNGCVDVTHAEAEIERIFELATSMQLVVLDCDTVNYPTQLLKTSLAPYIVCIRIDSRGILSKLIRTCRNQQNILSDIQISAFKRLNQCSPDKFDLILNHSTLEAACDHLALHLEKYWQATHPPLTEEYVPRFPNPGHTELTTINECEETETSSVVSTNMNRFVAKVAATARAFKLHCQPAASTSRADTQTSAPSTNQRLPIYQSSESWDRDIMYSPPAEANEVSWPTEGLPHPFHGLYVTDQFRDF